VHEDHDLVALALDLDLRDAGEVVLLLDELADALVLDEELAEALLAEYQRESQSRVMPTRKPFGWIFWPIYAFSCPPFAAAFSPVDPACAFFDASTRARRPLPAACPARRLRLGSRSASTTVSGRSGR